MSKPNIILVGPMGSGKSTIGKLIAKILHREFRDSDHYIEEKTGVDIARIFDIEGEQGFRDRESHALSELLKHRDRIIATGGGSVIRSENQNLLRASGFIIFLDTSIEQQMQRLHRDKKRPLLHTENQRACLEDLFAKRRPIYLALADLMVSTNSKSARKLTEDVLNQLPDHLY